jgi:hypothetical protein
VLLQSVEDLLNVLQVFFPTLVEDEDVIQIYNHKGIGEGHKMSSINLMKVVGEFVKSKGMTNHSKRPSLDLKVVFHTLVYSIGTWW